MHLFSTVRHPHRLQGLPGRNGYYYLPKVGSRFRNVLKVQSPCLPQQLALHTQGGPPAVPCAQLGSRSPAQMLGAEQPVQRFLAV
jgi:hypothetical protein